MHQNLSRILKAGGENSSPFEVSYPLHIDLFYLLITTQFKTGMPISSPASLCTTCGMFLIMRVPLPVWGLSVEWLTWLHWLALGRSKPATWASSALLCGRRFSEGLLVVLHDRPPCAHSNHPQHCRRIKRYTTEPSSWRAPQVHFPSVCSYRSWICVLRDTTGRVEHKLFTRVIPQSCSFFFLLFFSCTFCPGGVQAKRSTKKSGARR